MERVKRVLAGPWTPPGLGRMPYLWALSLGYMLVKYVSVAPGAFELCALVLTVLLFLPLYLASFWARGRSAVACVLATCLFGCLWAPFNPGASSFFIYACAMCAGLLPRRRAYLLLAAVLVLAAAIGLNLPYGHFLFLVPALSIGLPVGIGAIMEADLRRSREQLVRKQEEVEHMATIAERERISRDLHDLLGHSLSMIALKAELAGKLLDRSTEEPRHRAACRREVADIEQAARATLAEVRAAVSNYRHSGLAQALAGARASLAAAEVELSEEVERIALAPAAEHVVALALREAVTNVVRHAGARRCTLSLLLEEGSAVLRVTDDGTRLRDEHDLRHGNGLTGMQERAAALGGRLALRVRAGLALELRIPVGGHA